ncbi:predicted protein [Arabidopsis lyrata subsp. lyrata]|uniref:Predicted protein n=1 Tax=Arabidopsis lyrata subsp. lyrata TaxID=81972 RepID=D7LYH7_ARALL|nr:predicted protein [Arabidopsis lyrata subsp. lyrata]
MARARSRSRSYSPRPLDRSPPPRARKSYDDYRHRERPSSRDHESSGPSGLLIRNLPLDARSSSFSIVHRHVLIFNELLINCSFTFTFSSKARLKVGIPLVISMLSSRNVENVHVRHRHKKVREDDLYSPRRSRSISRSPLPRNEREYKSSNVSRSPRRNCRSPGEESVLTPIKSRSLSRSRSRSLR